MQRNNAPVTGHEYPGIRIHVMDIVQPPGIGIPGIAAMDPHQSIVSAALAAKSNAETPAKTRWEVRSEVRWEVTPAYMLRHRRGSKLATRFVRVITLSPFAARFRGLSIGRAVVPVQSGIGSPSRRGFWARRRGIGVRGSARAGSQVVRIPSLQ
jgi:hypothetical protein